MSDQQPAMTMREIRESLGHAVPPPGVPEPSTLATRYVVSCLPEGHDDRHTFTVQVQYRGAGRYTVTHNLKFADLDGRWEYGLAQPEDPDDDDMAAETKWREAHSFDHDTALRLARQLAPTLTCRGRTVADVLAESGSAA
ncbi:hypothetical protein [Streptomyces sp. NPDC001652]|uniref:hypothetical protein n=1 Tax=Streptomyces sp. NPDC001652 TaxID=3154393 RepID=UPI003325AEF9